MKKLILALFILAGTAHAQWLGVVGSKTISGSTPAATPTFSPVAGTYSSTQTVTISTTTGSVICYNTTGSPATNGSTGCTTGTLYTGTVSVSSSETLYAVAGGTGYTDSSVASAAYVITAPVNYGITSIGGLNIVHTSYNPICFQFTTGSNSSGYSLQSLSAYVKVASGTAGMEVGIGASLSAYPTGTGQYLSGAGVSSGTITTTAAWQTVALSGTLAASTSYLGCFQHVGTVTYYYNSNSTGSQTISNTGTYGTWPTTPNSVTFVLSSPGEYQPSIYVTVGAN